MGCGVRKRQPRWEVFEGSNEIVEPERIRRTGVLGEEGDERATCHFGQLIARAPVLEVPAADGFDSEPGQVGQHRYRPVLRFAVQDDDLEFPRAALRRKTLDDLSQQVAPVQGRNANRGVRCSRLAYGAASAGNGVMAAIR